MCEDRDQPWLQDTADTDWWGTWAVGYRDVIIMDSAGELAGIYNLTDNPLTNDDNYATLKALLIEVAETE